MKTKAFSLLRLSQFDPERLRAETISGKRHHESLNDAAGGHSSACGSARRAFTLIELLVVIAIIGILANLMLPVLTKVREQSQSISCLSNVRQIALAGYLYAQDHDHYVGWRPGIDRKQLLYPYLDTGRSNEDTDGDQVWHCPGNLRQEREASYGFNIYLNWRPLETIRSHSATVAVADAGINDWLEPILATHLMPPSTHASPNIGRPNPRHRSGSGAAVNVAFVDGHASRLPMEPPFYPDVPGRWFGNGILDPNNPDYQDGLWDLR
ncbi:MAG: type II secretion system protein [Opitutales bacterium]